MAAHQNPSIPLSHSPKHQLYPPQPPSNPSIAPPFGKASFESMSRSTTLDPSSSHQDISRTEEKDYNPTTSNPFSAFYLHPTTRTSLEQARSESKINIKVYEHDLEAGSRVTQSHPQQEPTSPSPEPGLKKHYTMWPAKCQEREKKHNVSGTIRGSRACAPYRGLSKKQRLVLQIVVAILIVGAATGLGIGISKAVGAGVWKTDNSTAPIGPPEDE